MANLKRVGRYQLGDVMVELITDGDSSGGAFYIWADTADLPVDGKDRPTIQVGLDFEKWYKVYGVLAHEAYEFAYTEMGRRFTSSRGYSNTQSDYQFVLTHEEFTEANARASMFVDAAAAALKWAWRKHRRQVRLSSSRNRGK